MDRNLAGKQIFDFYKSTFEKTINAMILFQEQNQEMIDLYLEQMPELPEENRKAIQDWKGCLKKGTLDFKACMDEGFRNAEKYFSRQAGAGETGKQRSGKG